MRFYLRKPLTQPHKFDFTYPTKKTDSRCFMPYHHHNECCHHQTSPFPRIEAVELVVLGLPLPAHCSLGPGIVNSFIQLCSKELGLELHPDNIIYGYFKPKMEGSRSIAWLRVDRMVAGAIMHLKRNLPDGISVERTLSPYLGFRV